MTAPETPTPGTPLPWAQDEQKPRVIVPRGPDPKYSLLGLDYEDYAIVFNEKDAAYIVHACNRLPEAERALAAAQAQCGELRAALDRLISECIVHRTSPPDYAWAECLCGAEHGKHEADCPVQDARAVLARTAQP